MQALALIRQLRFQLQLEMDALPECFELENTDRVLSIYEQLVIQKGLEQKQIEHKVQEAFEFLFAIARERFQEQKLRSCFRVEKSLSTRQSGVMRLFSELKPLNKLPSTF
jgi:hypothetical protein